MNEQFDELAKGLAQSVTRRQALKKFGVGLAGLAMAGLISLRVSAQVSQIGPLVELSQPNPVGNCDDGFSIGGTFRLNDATEPNIAVKPLNPNNVVASWIQRVNGDVRYRRIIKREGSPNAEPVVTIPNRVGLRELHEWAYLGDLGADAQGDQPGHC